jgi:inosine-uridine nucleoside N-ribohydrolase
MGGVVDERALPRPIREDIVRRGVHAAWPDHNTASDPEAALICARSGALLTWVPGEVTFAVPLRRAIGDALPTDRWLTLALEGMTAAWDAWWRDHGAALGASTFLHDPLTVSALLAPGWLTLRACALRHEIADGVFRLREDAAGEARARVAVAADGARFERVMLGRIARHLRTAGVPRAG